MKNLIALIVVALLQAGPLRSQPTTSDTTFYSNLQPCSITLYEHGVRVERTYYFRTGERMVHQRFDPRTGLQHGDETWWWRNGKVMHACSYVYGEGHGPATSYGWDGTVEKRELYVEGVYVPEDQWGKFIREERPLAER